jgi:hypothetical protein
MRILLVSATALEIKSVTGTLTFIGKESEELYRFRVKNSLVDSLVTGVGMIPAAVWTATTGMTVLPVLSFILVTFPTPKYGSIESASPSPAPRISATSLGE